MCPGPSRSCRTGSRASWWTRRVVRCRRGTRGVFGSREASRSGGRSACRRAATSTSRSSSTSRRSRSARVVTPGGCPSTVTPTRTGCVRSRCAPRRDGPTVTHGLRVGDVVTALDSLYDPRWAQDWDAVGLVVGDPDQPVRRVLLAVDPVQAVVDEAVDWGADLLVTHHPLLLRGVHSVATTHPKGRAVTALVRAGVALHVAHTNADVADPGVSDALAAALGLTDLRPLQPLPADPLDKVVTFVPEADAEAVVDALAAAGAGQLGAYERCAVTAPSTGTFTPLPGADPAIGA